MSLNVENHPELGKIFDISPVVSSKLALFQGETPFELKTLYDFNKGDSIKLSSLSTTLHIGSHTDSPNHFHPKGEPMHKRSLQYYIGRAQVVHCLLPIQKGGRRLTPKDVDLSKIKAPRVLFRTDSYLDPSVWSDDFTAFSPELIFELSKSGVFTIGIDTPSVDPAQDQKLLSHHAVFETGMANLEGLSLKDVPEGEYFFCALPLKLENAEASPVRAILMQERL